MVKESVSRREFLGRTGLFSGAAVCGCQVGIGC